MAPVDILTDLVIVIVPVMMMVPVQVAMSKKATIVAAFSFRILVIAATIARLFYINPATNTSRDATFDAVNYNILTQVVLSISILTACIPCLKPFLDSFDSGMMGVSFKDRIPGGGSHSQSGNRDYKMRDLAYGNIVGAGHPANMASALRSHNYDKDTLRSMNDTDVEIDTDPRNKMGVSVEVVADNGRNNHHARDRSPRQHNRGGETGSVASSSKSDQMIIKKNIQWTVEYEDHAQQAAAHERGGNTERSLSRRQSAAMRHDRDLDDKSSDAETLGQDIAGAPKIAYAL